MEPRRRALRRLHRERVTGSWPRTPQPHSCRQAGKSTSSRRNHRRGRRENRQLRINRAATSVGAPVSEGCACRGVGDLPSTRVRAQVRSQGERAATAATRSRMFVIPVPAGVWSGSKPAPESQTTKRSASPVSDRQTETCPGPACWRGVVDRGQAGEIHGDLNLGPATPHTVRPHADRRPRAPAGGRQRP